MPSYSCDSCLYYTRNLSHFNKHINTKKHIANIRLKEIKVAKSGKKSSKSPQNSLNLLKISSKNPQKSSKNYICENCGKCYSRIDNFKRHQEIYCKHKGDNDINLEIKSLKEQKELLLMQIDKLLKKVGNTTITNTNNSISINGYGKEDVSYITGLMKTNMLKMPYGMIPKMVKEVHFNKNKPENQNLMIVNKKENYISVFDGTKWNYHDKNEIISDLIDGKYYMLDNHYDNSQGNGLSSIQTQRYEDFRNKIDSEDKELLGLMKKQCELTILNSRKD